MLRQKDAAANLGVGHFAYMTWEKDQSTPFPRGYPKIIKWHSYNPLPAAQTNGDTLRTNGLLGFTFSKMADTLGIGQETLLTRERH